MLIYDCKEQQQIEMKMFSVLYSEKGKRANIFF